MNRTARLGAFILFTLAILLTGIFIIGSKRYLFTPTYELKAQFANVAGLQQGADVMVGGLHAGTVKAVDLPNNPDGKLTVTMMMNESTRKIVRKNSIASIETEGLLGNQYVAVSFGASDQAEVKSGDTIASVPPLQMSELVAKANGLLGEGQAAMKNINQVSEHLKSVSAKIDQGQGTVGALINDRSIYNNFDETAKKADATVASAQTGIKDFQDNMEALKHNFLLRGFFKNRGYEDSADLGKDAIANAPDGTPVKEFDYDAKDLFDKQDTARLKGQKKLKDAGEYLAGNDFGVAVIEIAAGAKGSSDTDMTLAEGRALALRDYIVQHYGFDDTKLKTLSLGKQPGEVSKSGWGEIKILIYPVGTAMPPDKNPDKSQQDNSSQSSR
ncbi:MlaD family protein [Acidicapsa dinghuensis]|uniref:MlaD family protein n=1 Tax=Acidicapsa dinghuensis TaxID=2218256 RepID=A0ABW1EEP2_9BACT|nr:MlaD family protein [Acidicapsa dinghuensis]